MQAREITAASNRAAQRSAHSAESSALSAQRASGLSRELEAARRELQQARAEHSQREQAFQRECEQVVSQAMAQMEGSLYRAHAAHERAALHLQQSEQNVMRRDALIAELSAKLADARERLRAHGLEPPPPEVAEWLGVGGSAGSGGGDEDSVVMRASQ